MIKSLPADTGDARNRHGFHPWVGKIPWSRKCQHTPVLLPSKFREQRSLVGYSPWDHKLSTAQHVQLYSPMNNV